MLGLKFITFILIIKSYFLALIFFQKLTPKVRKVVFCKCCKSNSKVTFFDRSPKLEDGKGNIEGYVQQKKKLEEAKKKPEKEPLTDPEPVTWQDVSKTLDRLLFIVYAVFVLMLAVVFSIILNG